MKNKIITLIGINYFPEDTAIGLYSTQMVEYFKDNGFEVNVVTGFPYYPQWEISKAYKGKDKFLVEEVNGIKIFRYKQFVPKKPTFIKRVFHLIDFTIGSLFNIRKIKQTNVIIVVVPFTFSILLGWILKKRTNSKLWIHIQDFEFDAALQVQVTRKDSLGLINNIFKLLFKLEKFLLSKADLVSTISLTMIEKLKSKTSGETIYLPNWIDLDFINPIEYKQHNYLASKKFKILYSGNIGEKQDWNIFIELVNKLDKNNYDVIIVGSGANKQWLKNKIDNLANVYFYNPVPYSELSDLLCSTDIHLLFQKNDVTDTVMPSKLLGMMASSKPSIVTGNIDSEVRKILEESRGGKYFSNGDVLEIIDFIEHLRKNSLIRERFGVNARDYVQKKFSKKNILFSFLRTIDKL